MSRKTVYLTFDDGIQPGTMEVLRSLHKIGVKATFFLTGLNTYYGHRRNVKLTLEVLEHLCVNHTIGNHSFSHCHDFYSSYYTKGLLVDNNGQRLPASEDFEKNVLYFNSLLEKLHRRNRYVYDKSVNSISTLARLPGRNSWYFSRKSLNSTSAETFNTTDVIKFESDSSEVAKNLYNAGYQIFGWNDEWRMSFDFHADGKLIKDAMTASSGIDYTSCDQVYIDFDMYLPENLFKDRLIESWLEVASRVEHGRQDRIIMLMHDRAFRGEYSESLKLERLIVFLQRKGILFDTLDNY